MLTNLRGIRRSTLGCAAALLLIAPAAQAAAPEPCDGKLLVKDAAGDAAYKQQGTVLFPGPANADATGLFFRSDEGKLTANVVIADLTKTLPTGFQAVRYRVYVTVGGSVKYLQALLTSSGVAYTYGSQLQAVYTKNGDTTGAFHEGKNGVVQIVVPAAIAKTGTKMDAISVSNGLLTAASAPEEGQLPPVYFGLDTAPDGASSTVTTTAPADCPPPPAPPAPPAEAPAAPPAEAPAPPAPAAAPSGPVLGEPFQAKGDLRMSLAKSKLSARKVKRRLRLSLRSNERLTFATVKLQRGWRVLSRLDLDVLGARTTLKMKLGRRLARRAHTLIVRGTLPDGTMATQRLRLRITR